MAAMRRLEVPRVLGVLLNGLAASGLIPAAVAAAMLLAAGAALGAEPNWLTAGLAAAGTLVVYGVDHLRDADLDRNTSPVRTRFVDEHRHGLWALTATAGVAASALVLAVPRDVQLLCAAVLAAGLLHRRLKRFELAKPMYVAVGWVAVTAGIPALSSPASDAAAWVLAIYAGALSANVVAVNGRPALAVLLAGTGAAFALIGPAEVLPLVAIPAAELAALIRYRDTERYQLITLDAALLVGAVAALAASPWF